MVLWVAYLNPPVLFIGGAVVTHGKALGIYLQTVLGPNVFCQVATIFNPWSRQV